MATLPVTPGLNSDANLSSSIPRTPPYTPRNPKTQAPTHFEPFDSPTSNRSLHTPDTINSPQKGTHDVVATDDVQIEELVEGDAGFNADINDIYPAEVEEMRTESDEATPSSEDEAEDAGISRQFSRLDCADGEEAGFEKLRHEKHTHRRTSSRIFKRSHSQYIKSDTKMTDVDPDSMAAQDNEGTVRRLRRRVRGPGHVEAGTEIVDLSMSSPELSRLAPAEEIRERRSLQNFPIRTEDAIATATMTDTPADDDDDDDDDDEEDDDEMMDVDTEK